MAGKNDRQGPPSAALDRFFPCGINSGAPLGRPGRGNSDKAVPALSSRATIANYGVVSPDSALLDRTVTVWLAGPIAPASSGRGCNWHPRREQESQDCLQDEVTRHHSSVSLR